MYKIPPIVTPNNENGYINKNVKSVLSALSLSNCVPPL